jgi:hypothetical protein
MKTIFGFIKHKCIMFIGLMLALCLGSLQIASAYDKIDVNKACSIELVYQDDGIPITGASFQLYYVADVDENIEFKVEHQFENSGVDIPAETALEWSNDASTLGSYIAYEDAKGTDIKPVAEGVTDEDGRVKFAGLETGLYLLTGDKAKANGKEYTPVDTLITLPYAEGSEGFEYNPEIFPKEVSVPFTASETPEQPTTEPYQLKVQKIWNDTGYETLRPESVTVVLLKDGEDYDKVVLNKENNWRYIWSGLDENATWKLYEEDIPTNYTVTCVLDEDTFIVTNTRHIPTGTSTSSSGGGGGGGKRTEGTTSSAKVTTEAETEVTTAGETEITTEREIESTTTDTDRIYHPSDDNNPGDSDTTPEVETEEEPETFTDEYGNVYSSADAYKNFRKGERPEDDPDANPEDSPNGSNPTGSSQNGKLPQTGQAWWPIPVLLSCGFVLLLAGYAIGGGKEDEEA